MDNTSSAELIQTMVQRIVDYAHPDKIILFGSHARGTAGPDSDVDLLVIMPVNSSKREKRIELRMLLNGIGIPKDVVVATPKEEQQCTSFTGTVLYPALREGILLYAKPA